MHFDKGKIIIFRCMQTIISQGVDFTAALHPTRAANEQSAKFSQSQRMPLLGPFLGWNQLLALSHKTLLRLRTFVWTLEALSDTHSCYCDIVERVFVMLECYKMRTDFVKMCLSEAPISHVAAEELPSRINNTTSVCCTLAMSRWKWHFYIYTFPTKSLQKLQFFPWI